MFVDYVLEPEEKEKMVKNIISMFKHEELFSKDFITKLNRLNQDQLINLYLDEKGDYYKS